MNFPILDRLPIPSRIRARQEVRKFADNLCDQIRRSNEKLVEDDGEITVAKSMIIAEDQGMFTKKMFRDNAVIVFVAGHENPQLSLTSLLYICAKYPVCLINCLTNRIHFSLSKY